MNIKLRAMAALFLIFSGALLSCGQSGSVVSVAPDGFEQMMKAPPDSVVLLDVRTPEEYAGGHLAGAGNIDVQAADFKERVAQIDRSKPVLVYCKSGRRSSMAAEQLEQMGFKKVYNLTGGYDGWQDAGKAVE